MDQAVSSLIGSSVAAVWPDALPVSRYSTVCQPFGLSDTPTYQGFIAPKPSKQKRTCHRQKTALLGNVKAPFVLFSVCNADRYTTWSPTSAEFKSFSSTLHCPFLGSLQTDKYLFFTFSCFAVELLSSNCYDCSGTIIAKHWCLPLDLQHNFTDTPFSTLYISHLVHIPHVRSMFQGIGASCNVHTYRVVVCSHPFPQAIMSCGSRRVNLPGTLPTSTWWV